MDAAREVYREIGNRRGEGVVLARIAGLIRAAVCAADDDPAGLGAAIAEAEALAVALGANTELLFDHYLARARAHQTVAAPD